MQGTDSEINEKTTMKTNDKVIVSTEDEEVTTIASSIKSNQVTNDSPWQDPTYFGSFGKELMFIATCMLAQLLNQAGQTHAPVSYTHLDVYKRQAQACDRCRSKKTRCDGKRPQCSQCAAVGFECRISDKLLRKAYPKGYTESLEERVRELEAENKRLLALCDIKEQQISLVSQSRPPTSIDNTVRGNFKQDLKDAPLNLSSTNIYLLNQTVNKQLQNGKVDSDNSTSAMSSLEAPPPLPHKDHLCDGVSCTNHLHVKPTSTSSVSYTHLDVYKRQR